MRIMLAALALGAALLTGCGGGQSVTDRVTDDAWNGKSTSDRDKICAGVELFGADWVARQIEDGAKDRGVTIEPGTDFKAMALRIEQKCEAR